MGVYADSAALRAMAAVQQVHLVVVTTNLGPSIGHARRGMPYDSVNIYPPSTDTALVRQRSWAHDVVPVLLRCAEKKAKRTDPSYRVILHNGEPPGDSGHFDAILARVEHLSASSNFEDGPRSEGSE